MKNNIIQMLTIDYNIIKESTLHICLYLCRGKRDCELFQSLYLAANGKTEQHIYLDKNLPINYHTHQVIKASICILTLVQFEILQEEKAPEKYHINLSAKTFDNI